MVVVTLCYCLQNGHGTVLFALEWFPFEYHRGILRDKGRGRLLRRHPGRVASSVQLLYYSGCPGVRKVFQVACAEFFKRVWRLSPALPHSEKKCEENLFHRKTCAFCSEKVCRLLSQRCQRPFPSFVSPFPAGCVAQWTVPVTNKLPPGLPILKWCTGSGQVLAPLWGGLSVAGAALRPRADPLHLM